MKEIILIFQLEDSSMKTAIGQALLPFHVRLKKVEPSEYNKPLGALAGLPGFEADGSAGTYTGAPLPAPMMIFAGLPENKFDRILRQLRNHKVILPYKAVLTPTNPAWTPLQCFEEIKREHESMNCTL